MRISDWSSDVCSSDLHGARQDAADLVQESFARLAGARAKQGAAIERPEAYLSTIACNLLRDRARIALSRSLALHIPTDELGRASCRERVCQYVMIPVVAVALQTQMKKTHNNKYSNTHTT